jgi:hypothetical protein
MSDRTEGLPGRWWRASPGWYPWRPGSGRPDPDSRNGADTGQGGAAGEVATPEEHRPEADEDAESGAHAGEVAHRPPVAERGEIAEDLRDLAKRVRILGIALAGIAIDLGFLGGWLVLIKVFHELVYKLGTVPGVPEGLQAVLTDFFDIATLVGVLSYVVRDAIKSVKRVWKKDDEDS